MPHKDKQKGKECKARYYQEHKAKCDTANKKWIKEHPKEFRKIQQKYMITKGNKKKRGAKNRKYNLKKYFGLTIEQYDQMSEKQNHVCAICGKTETVKNQHGLLRLSVDHNHTTDKIRGLLCSKCNFLLGHADEDIDILLNAIQYLRDYK